MKCPKCRSDNPSETRFCGNCGVSLHPEKDIAFTETMQTHIRELTAGTTFARRYQIIEDLGKGGMGRVYKVFDTEVREKMALKLLNPDIASDEQTIERFRNELKLARGISHRNICRMYDLGREEGSYYITMECVSGEDLKSLIHRIGALPIGKAVSIARQVGEGLAEAHRLGVVHRDLKPQNIMIDREGNARIMDFGIARSLKAKGITGGGVMIGTPEYMSPEQVDGKEADRRSDIYSLGIVLFEMLTGRLPFEGDTPLSVAVKQKSEAPPDPRKFNTQIPEDLKKVVLKCLDKAKDKRYQSADEILEELGKIEKGLPATTQPLPIRKPLTSRQITVRLPSKKFWVPAVILLVLALAFVVWQIIPQPQGSKRSVAVIGFKNQTGDKSFDYLQETIPNLLITSLEQSGHFRVTSWQRLQDLLRQSGKDGAAVLDEESGFEICREEGIEALVVGFYSKAGETFVTDVKVLDAATKQLLKGAQSKGEGAASILKTQIDEISRNVSRGIGLPILKIEKSQPKIIDLTTNSMEAYNYFLRGRDDWEKYYHADARKFLEKAVALDPTFAVAYLYLSKASSVLADFKAGDEALEKAKQYSGKATEKERLYIEAQYARIIERNPEKRQILLRELTEKYPQEKNAHFELGFFYEGRKSYLDSIGEYEKAISLDPNFGYAINQLAYVHAQMGNFEKAIQYFQGYASVNPGDANPLDSIAELYLRMGKLDEAGAKYKEVLAMKPDFYSSCRGLAYVSALQENYAEVNHWLEEFIARAPSPTAKMEGYWLKAYYGYFQGRWDESLAEYISIREQTEKAGVDYIVSTVDWLTGYIHCDRGEFDVARKAFQAYIAYNARLNPSTRAFSTAAQSFLLGWVELKQGRAEAAKTRRGEIKPLLPGVDSANRETMTFLFQLLSAEIALAENSVDQAIATGEKMTRLNFPNVNTPNIADYNMPFLKDVLARAYWKKGDLDKAAAEYEKLITIDPKNQVRYLIHPLYHYRLGRVFEEKGFRDRAAEQYTKFLQYWKDADEKIPEKADARQRLAKLK